MTSILYEDGAEQRQRLRQRVTAIVKHVARLLPDQGPIGMFIHHNTLHAFQHLPFHQAVAEASRLYGTEPYMQESAYRSALQRGRIRFHDLRQVLQSEDTPAPPGYPEALLPFGTLQELSLRFELSAEDAPVRRFLMEEMGRLRAFRSDIPAEARERLLQESIPWLRAMLERGELSEVALALTGTHDVAAATAQLRTTLELGLNRAHLLRQLERDPQGLVLHGLWTLCRQHLDDQETDTCAPVEQLRVSPRLSLVTGEDLDRQVHRVLIPMLEGFLDQGQAYWPMPGRERGFYLASRDLLSIGAAPPIPWLRLAGVAFQQQAQRHLDAVDVIVDELESLGAEEHLWEDLLLETALTLKGWAGMMARLERRPDELRDHPVPARLADFLAVRLTLDRAAVMELVRRTYGRQVSLVDLPTQLGAPAAPDGGQLAWRTFQLCEVAGLSPPRLLEASTQELEGLGAGLTWFNELERRRIFHEAYERRHRKEVLAGMQQNAALQNQIEPVPAKVQFIFCIDEREESIRRHLEELDPAYETLGAVGFYNFPIAFKGIDHVHPDRLCPAVQRPIRAVVEVPAQEPERTLRRRRDKRSQLGRALWSGYRGSRSLGNGFLWSALGGWVAALPLITRLVSPRHAARARELVEQAWAPKPTTRLVALRDTPHGAGEQGLPVGFDPAEAAHRVFQVLEEMGITTGLAELVVVLGHGSTSWNNPHGSSYECGACSGHKGGTNARLFAQAANHPEVRAELAKLGAPVPTTTWFVGGIHDTANCDVELYDLDLVPTSHREVLEEATRALDAARTLSAHERCRRFESAPLQLSPAAALRHVQARAQSLAQPRPEYGHCTNAVCYVGRRWNTRGLFLDRRAFLVSYNPDGDPHGQILERILTSVAPVGAGISLEYYFSFVDNEGYGCGTKLPHNVTALLGVMNGHLSDLRTGLPRQVVEIHEPVRLLTVVETTPECIIEIAERQPVIQELVGNQWIQLATFNPRTGAMHVFQHGSFRSFEPDADATLSQVQTSRDWYGGHREHLPLARVLAGLTQGGQSC